MQKRIITIDDLLWQATCPSKRYYTIKYNGGVLPSSISKLNFFIQEMIKECYVATSKLPMYYNTQWLTIKNKVDKYCFNNIDINIEADYEAAYKKSIDAINILHSWYFDYFVSENRESVVNLISNTSISNSIVRIELPIIIFSEKDILPVIFSTTEEEKIPNSLRIKIILWAIYKETGIWPSKFLLTTILKTKIKLKEINNNGTYEDIDKAVNGLALTIQENIRYPSVNEQCINCGFTKICGI